MKLYKVGGAVRDELMGIEPKDVDYAIEAPSFEAMLAWIRDRADVFVERPEFGTVRARFRDSRVAADFVLCRKDGRYTDARHPDSVEPGTILDDLARRDFTVNAIAVDVETGVIIDPHNGRDDIYDRRLFCVGPARDRLIEDPLRVLRAVRFVVTRGMFISPSIKKVLNDPVLWERFAQVAVERKRDELEICFRHDTSMTIAELHDLDRYTPRWALTRDLFDVLWLRPLVKPKGKP